MAAASASGRVGDAGCDVDQTKIVVLGEPRDLEDDAPGPGEVRDVGLHAASEARTAWMLRVAVAQLVGGYSGALVAATCFLKRLAGAWLEAVEVGGEEAIVESDGDTVPSARGRQRG